MFGVLAEVREAMEVVAGTFDRSALTPEECRRIVDEASRVAEAPGGTGPTAPPPTRWPGPRAPP
jgi:hypothetical protein